MNNIFVHDVVLCKDSGSKSKRLNIIDLIFTLEKDDFITLMQYLYCFENDIPIFAFSYQYKTNNPWHNVEKFIEQRYKELYFLNSSDYEDFI